MSSPSTPPEFDQTTLLFRSKAEEEWEARRNTFLEAHPYLVGYAFLAVPVVLIFATKLTTFAVAFLFLFLVSDVLTHDLRRWVPFVPKAAMFALLYIAVTALTAALVFKFVPDLLRLVPAVAVAVKEQAIHAYAEANARWNLSQYVTQDDVVGQVTEGIKFAGDLVPSVTGAVSRLSSWVVYFVFALVLNLLLYHDLQALDVVFGRRPQSLLGFLYRFGIVRVRVFYYYFKRVMGGQLIIAGINTVISMLVVLGLGLPQPLALVLTVFLCGLLPIVGNLISNAVLTCVAFASIGVWGALICIGLLIAIHKLEYFLNSKIIGDIVKLPMAVTLAALVVAEVLLGLVGLILAIPLLLFVRHELEHVPGLPASHPAEPSRVPLPMGDSGPTPAGLAAERRTSRGEAGVPGRAPSRVPTR
ncbi:MAG: AI-2E family transporter [Deltaproteobacteria bacterium]|nr:AI-2E family transporter [Deltaproteobacteria bacterium]